MSIDKFGRHLYNKVQSSDASAPSTSTSLPLYLCQPVNYYSKCVLTVTTPYPNATPNIYYFPIGGKIESVRVFPVDLFFHFSKQSFDSKQVIGYTVQKDDLLLLGNKTGKTPALAYAEIVLQVPISKDVP